MPPLAMAPTRRAQPLEIYQDPVSAHYHHDPHHRVESALLQALGPLSDASGRHNPVLEPSFHHSSAVSPRKSEQQSSSPAGPLAGRTLNSNAAYYPAYPPSSAPNMHHLPHESYYAHIPNGQSMDKENVYNTSFDQQTMQYHDNPYGYKAPLKRTLTDAAPPKDKPNAKRPKTEEPQQAAFVLPEPHEMPDVDDDGSKPSISYANLIGMAILRAPSRRLTLAQIYTWISDHFKFYRAKDAGWQNSIRHNLSLNKNFIKQERPKDDPGKGNYWAIKPGQEYTFLKDRPIRKIVQGDNTTFVQATQHDFNGTGRSSTPAIGQFTLAPSSSKRFESKAIDSSKFPEEPLSSDGTLPGSDPALQEDEQQDNLAMPPPASRNIRSSPPPEDIGSSPPPMVSESARQGTPPALPRYASGSRSGDRLKYNNMNDSGYYSSIESSVTRGPGYANMVPTSDADVERPRHRRGRAEEELARIRGSSYDSPSKEGHRRKTSVRFDTSSPKRADASSGCVPLTPAVVFKKPALPPASISPNTNLKNHRARMERLLGESPTRKNMTPLRENFHTWSPHYSILDTEHFVSISPAKNTEMTPWRDHLFGNAFDGFDSTHQDDLSARGSPEKRSRPRIERAVTSTGILADITGNSLNRAHAAIFPPSASASTVASPFNLDFSPFKMTPTSVTQRSPVRVASPIKRPMTALPPPSADFGENAPEWLDLSLENLFGLPENHRSPGRQSVSYHNMNQQQAPQLLLPSDASEEGFDILQEFGKIGAHIGQQRFAQPSQGSPVKRPQARPPMSRSVTSRF